MTASGRGPLFLRLLAVFLVLSLTGAACGGGGGPDVAATEDKETVSSTQDETSEASEPGAETANLPVASCDDPEGDVRGYVSAKPGNLPGEYSGPLPDHGDLKGVELSLDDETLLLRYVLGGPVPTSKGNPKAFPFFIVRLNVYVNGLYKYELYSFTNGTDMGAAEYSKGGATKLIDLSGAVISVEGSEVRAEVPAAALPELGGNFDWLATLNTGAIADPDVAGKPRTEDVCPNIPERSQGALYVR